jgi:mevalonate kinase
MELKLNSDFSVLYDGKPMMKAITTQKRAMTEDEKKIFILKLNQLYKTANELTEQLAEIYELHSNRNLGDAMVSIAECKKSINIFNSSLQ